MIHSVVPYTRFSGWLEDGRDVRFGRERFEFRIAKKASDPVMRQLLDTAGNSAGICMVWQSDKISVDLADRTGTVIFGTIGHVPDRVAKELSPDLSEIECVHCYSVGTSTVRSVVNRRKMMDAVDMIDDLTDSDFDRLILAVERALDGAVIVAKFSIRVKEGFLKQIGGWVDGSP